MTRGAKIGVAVAVVGGAAAVTGIVLAVMNRKNGGLGRAGVTVKGRTSSGGRTLTHHRARNLSIDKRVGLVQDTIWKSVQDPQMRKLALQITAGCTARDGQCEARAIDAWMRKNIRYTGDIAPVKMGKHGPVEAIDLFQTASFTAEAGGGDCLPSGTLLLTEGHKLVPIEEVRAGMKIWGRDSWTDVEVTPWYKGILPVDSVELNNGSSFKATSEHKVYVAHCVEHENRAELCSCPVSEREIRRILVSDLEDGMVMVSPERIAFGTGVQDADLAYLDGLFISDGWSDQPSRFCISGKDGHPKEAQKHEVEVIAQRLGLATRMHEKYIAVNDRNLALRMQQMGGHAWQKHALSLDLDEGAAAGLLRGIMADSGKNTNGSGRTFTTTSRELMLQTRLLHKMFGITCSERYIVDHGGLGEHPIWRLGVRDQRRNDGNAEKLLRVKRVDREVMSLPTWDIQTADHHVYLPEADVTVSNCDDHAVFGATMLTLNGITARLRVTSPNMVANDWRHIYVVAGLPKERPSQWIALDSTLPNAKFGDVAGHAKAVDFPVPGRKDSDHAA